MPKISDRLRKLEEASGAAIPSEAGDLLVQLLARRDAMFWPARRPDFALRLKQRQRAYRSKELGLSAKADGRADWKRQHHKRRALIDADFVEPLLASGQIQSLLLTAKGEATARAMVGNLLSAKNTEFMRGVLSDSWTRERELLGFGGEYQASQAEPLTELFFPLVVVGAVESKCDSTGQVWYRDTGESIPDEAASDLDASDAMSELYHRTFQGERQALENADLLDPYEVYIPIPTGL